MINVKCTNCGKALSIPDQYAGQTGKCNACGSQVAVPIGVSPVDDIAPRSNYTYPKVTEDRDWTDRGKNIAIMSCAGCVLLPVAAFSFLFFVGLIAQGADQARQQTQPDTKRTRQQTPPTPASNDITLAQFNRLRDGMTYQQVVEIFGRDGQVQSTNTLPNIDGSQIKTTMYSWKNDSFLGGNCSVMFQNDRLMSKSQFGLE